MSDSDEMNTSGNLSGGVPVDNATVDSHNKKEQGSSSQPRRELFVRSLPASVTTESLAEYFSQSYVIKHAVVVLDPKTKQSKGYGFVTFADVEDSKAALEEFNGSTFEGKKIKVDYAQPRQRVVDETGGKSVPSAAALERKKEREQNKADTRPPRLIVRNLPWSVKEPEHLAAYFRSFGKVKYVDLPKKGGELRGFGFVTLRGKKNAEKALEAVNGKEVDGRTLAVDWAVEKEVWENIQQEEQKQQEEKAEEESNDVDMDEAEADMDEDESLSVEDDDDDDVSMGESDEADEDEEDEEEPEEEKEDERNASTIFIRNLPFTCTDETLYEHFAQFGPLRYARIVVDPETERPRGTGFVCFWKPENAQSCVQEAPKQQDTLITDKEKAKKGSAIKHSILQNENSDPSGRYTLDGRVLQVSRAVSKSRATQLEEEGVSRRLVRDTDKRCLYLLQEGTVSPNSTLYKQLSPSEIKMREDSFKQRQNFIKKNPALHFSLTRLAVRNLPRHVTSKDLKQLARQAIVGFAKDAKEGRRQPLSKEEAERSSESMKEAEKLRKKKGVGVVRQAKIVFEGRDGSKVNENSGAGRSRGYGFIEFFTHRHALMCLRWLNGHAVEAPKDAPKELKDRKKRLIVEFAIENAQVVKRRNEIQEAKRRNFKKGDQKNAGAVQNDDRKNNSDPKGKKRKRSESGNGTGKGQEDSEEQNKIAKRNRIIAKKRMQRRTRKGNA
ncbi:hypothetical protein P175DRAFT_0504381 [Aspergillus ochraceoroseus IBT 24754]|uniref:RRM domain-containing protein n=1 Tax=Aspergillus ochraceoroseus IBT 24754 TaxID=1392256 RepID=A0A2T5LMY8_9EURO|nr:uncharacterized protein P175DRAFT_0504381 [Aspergillus ochraceoroseus IBT 24754]PTU17643.1 hypothetical protein P175DRAFT_0504381 [Aspergillus ochraceoroseus IBT 24754]